MGAFSMHIFTELENFQVMIPVLRTAKGRPYKSTLTVGAAFGRPSRCPSDDFQI